MSIAAEGINTEASNKVNGVIAQQRRLLKRWESVSHYLSGVCAGLYMPGINHTFDNPVRRVSGRRPVVLTLEADSLNFSGAISRPQGDKLLYAPIFSYDLTMPYTPRGGGRVLPANNIVLARRANELLSALVSYGNRVAFGTHEELSVFQFPKAVRSPAGKIVAEDYSATLGLDLPNSSGALQEVQVRRPNPAGKILARHGIEFPMSLSTPELETLVTEFKAELGGIDVDWATAVDCLLFQRAHCVFSMPLDEAVVHEPDAVVSAVRSLLPHRYQWEASFNDLLAAAKNPKQPLRINRLSAIQIFPVESAQDMPDDYAGTVLAPINWSPVDRSWVDAEPKPLEIRYV